MKKLCALLLALTLLTAAFSALAEEPAAKPPFASFHFEGTETGGATLLVEDIFYEGIMLNVRIRQQPDDDSVALVDYLLEDEYPPDVPYDGPYAEEDLAEASQYGTKLVGTLCAFISLLQDGAGYQNGYETKITRDGAALIYDLRLDVDPEVYGLPLVIEICAGIDEALSGEFEDAAFYQFDIPTPEEIA